MISVSCTASFGFDSHTRGPGFVMEPPARLEFSNSSGGWLDCSASGSPQPSVDWLSVDGNPVGDVGGVRRVLRNGTLVLLPFPAAAYRQDIHSTVYRCVASNSVGKVISRDVQVRAVVAQAYKVDIEVLGAARGCTAVLRCVVPSFVKELVRVVSWVQDPSFYIYPSLQGDGKFHLLPTGELLIHNLEFSDQFPTYRCRTMHRLSRQVVVSSPANVRLVEHRGIVSPSIVEHTGLVQVAQDEGAVLLCVAQGCPAPEYRWYMQSGPEPLLVLAGPRIRLLGPILAVEAVTAEDAGVYRCSASNAGGEASAELRLSVSTPLHVEVTPPMLSIHMGGSAEFRCLVTVHGASMGPHMTTWYKDGRQLPSSGRGGDTLIVTSVSREDRGMYQCIVRRPEGDTAQAAAELQLGDAPPVLMYSFIEQTLQPGPAVSLKCSAAGNPTPQISWSLDGFPLPTNGRFVIGQYVTVHGDVISHVNISHVMVEDGGEYTCAAENRAGRSSHSARLNVYGLPYIRLIPKVTAVAGETLQLKCPVAGYPIEEIHWERGGRELPDDIRQKVQTDGSLVISPVQKTADSGVYTCWARNKQGHSARRSGEVAVIVPPKLSPFHGSAEVALNVGDRASLTCSVVKGDLPLTMSWRKDGRLIEPSTNHRVSVTQVDQYNSILLIESLTPEHSGNYTCTVRNLASEAARWQRVVVNVPPRWVVEPSDVSVERNRHVILHCQAQGVPNPIVVWKKATGSKSGEYEDVRERPYTKLFSNGSLLLQHVKEDREGFYLCQANNGIGTGIGKVVQLKVNSSPYFSAPSRLVTVKKGESATLQCDVNGDKPINVIWSRGGKQELNPSTNYRVAVKQDVTPDGINAEILIQNVETSDSGAYFCQASNLYGKDQQLVQLLVQEPPQSPHALDAAMVSSRSVNIKWGHRTADSAEVNKYIVQFREGDRPWQQVDLSDVPLQHNALIEDLKPATRYIFRVIAEGPAGRSAPSPELSIRTEPQRPAGPPMNVAVRPVSSTEVLVTWNPPLSELRHGEIQGYNIGYRSTSSPTQSYNFTSVTGDGEDGSGEMLLGGLNKFTRYAVVVQAFNQVGPGPLSEAASAQTMEDVPTMPPEDVRCAALTSQSLQVSWQPPPTSHCNGLLQGYKLFYEPILNDFIRGNDEMETRKTTALTTVLTGLRKYTNYSMQVLAFTRMGDGILTHTTFCHTEEDVPEAPTDIKVVVSSPQSLFIAWKAPSEPNGVVTKYILYHSVIDGREELNHGKWNLPSQQLYYESKGLQQHVEYKFWVTASTRVGEGKSSRVAAQICSSRVPARIVSFGGPVVKPWRGSVSMPCQTVGQPRREWMRGETPIRAGAIHNMQLLDTGELFLTGLQTSDAGNYTCQVDNGIGSDRLTHTLIVQVPPGSPVLYVTSATSSSILLHWKAGNTGAAPISGYTLFYRRSHGNLEEMKMSRHASSHELKGLQCGSTYHLYLIAHNKIGSSPASPTLLVRTQGQAPGVPSVATLLSPNSSSVVLRLQVWPDNGCAILYFVLQYRGINDAQWTLVSNALKPQRRFTISGLQPASLYQLKMEAHNIAGSTHAEFMFVTLTKDGDPPPPELVKRGNISATIYYGDYRIIIPIIIFIVILIILIGLGSFCWKYRQAERVRKETLENQQNAEAQRERYYATIHKVALQAGDKIPETSEDISPYATFQLSEASTLAQTHSTGANTLLHSFMYHERAGTEGCASPPPPPDARTLLAGVRPGHYPRELETIRISSPYYNIGSKGARRRHSRKNEPESDDSESDPDQLTSSRTESSNQLDAKLKHSLIYHGTQSSTSSDLSPMSEQKSLPRRTGRSRWLVPTRSTIRTLSVAETNFSVPVPDGRPPQQHPAERGTVTPGDRLELSEAECDMDTLKKLKLGLRSSLWARPSGPNSGGQPSDYSIAV